MAGRSRLLPMDVPGGEGRGQRKPIIYKYQKSVANTVCTHHTTQIKLKQHYRNSYAASASLMKRKASNSAYYHQDQTTKQPYAT